MFTAIIIKEKNNKAIEIIYEGVRMVWRQKKENSVLEEQDMAI